MNMISTTISRLRLPFAALICVLLVSCTYLTYDSSPASAPNTILPTAELAFVSQCCHCDDAEMRLLVLSGNNVTQLSLNQHNAHEAFWSPNGLLLGMLSYATNQRSLGIIDVPTRTLRLELSNSILQVAWLVDDTSLVYLDSDEHLYEHTLAKGESTLITNSVSGFSVSPNEKWLGLSKRDPNYSNFFTFRALDLRNGRLLKVADQNGPVGANISAWSPTTNEVAVLFGSFRDQPSQIVMYSVLEDRLRPRAMVTALETYRHDYGKDSASIGFTDMAWSPDGQNLLAIRSATDAQPGGEVLKFDAALSKYERLPFGDRVTHLTWLDSRWLAYVTAGNTDTGDASKDCLGHLRGEIQLADMSTLSTQVVITDTLYIEKPAWRPQ